MNTSISAALRRVSSPALIAFLLVLAAAALGAQPRGLRIVSAGATTDQLSQYGITWTFAEPVEYGQFVNGDYWVLGPVEIVSVSPAPSVINGNYVHGSMVNPRLGSQGYDSRTQYYNSPYDHSARVDFPVVLAGDSSLVSTISRDVQTDRARPTLRAAAVLTVLSMPPLEGSFRPGLIGDQKPLYNANDIRWDRLPSLAPTSSAPSDLDYYADQFQRPWLLHNGNWTSRHISPTENMPSYHQDIALLLSHAAVAVMTDVGSDRSAAVTNLIQVAIDYFAMQQGGSNGRYNYRWPIIFAGIMLDDNGMRYMWRDGNYGTPAYQDDKIYKWGEHTRTQMSDIVPLGETWTGNDVFWRINTGNAGEHEHLDPSEWKWIESAGYSGGGGKQETYRRMHSVSTVGFGLAALAFNAATEFDFPAYFEYADRWM